MSDFVLVGRLALGTDHEIVAGVRPDTGQVQVYLNGPRDYKGLGFPAVSPDLATDWSELIQRAATAAEAIRAAHEQYQAALAATIGQV